MQTETSEFTCSHPPHVYVVGVRGQHLSVLFREMLVTDFLRRELKSKQIHYSTCPSKDVEQIDISVS